MKALLLKVKTNLTFNNMTIKLNLSLGIVVWGQSPAKNRAQPRKEMKSRCPGKAMQKRVFTVWNEFSLDWLCVARLTRLLL